MAEKSSFFNSELVGDTYDREYKAEDYANYFGSFIGNGVFPNPSNSLQVMATNSMNVTVKAGKAWINGYMYFNDSDLVLKIDPADGVLKRIDRIVVRLDLINRIASCKVLKGTFASSPIPPSLTRNNDIYELCVANISVNNGVISIIQSNITDTKLDDTVCGIVTQTIKEIDTTTLFNKLQGFIDERGKDVQYWMDTAVSQWEIDFNTWFETIKDILDGDVAGNLANRIKALEDKVGGGLLAENVSIKDTNNYFTATNVEGALNELFLNADNGKKTIATSVGSPLVNTDTFSAMGTKIDALTNTFKTNLTAKGVTVGSTDKMSILVDKVGSMTLGKKWASGTYSSNIVQSYNQGTTKVTVRITTNTTFVPTRIIVKPAYIFAGTSVTINNALGVGVSFGISAQSNSYFYNLSSATKYYAFVENVDSTGFNISIITNDYTKPFGLANPIEWETYE